MTAPLPSPYTTPLAGRLLDALARLAIRLLGLHEVQLEADLIVATAANQRLKEGQQ
ncbi:hypothetical protein ABT186_01645 [Streptomyces sp. NPDC001634]|uniref:hypothetical protein n=1 Tax=Streptomyces sp. NPDC001634 TaxID=3154390 RepID=UPI00332A0C02